MIISDDKQLVVYNDDYKPVNVFSGRKKIAGWKEEEYTGKHIEVEDTYNDALDVVVQGYHEQDSRNAVWWNQLIDVTKTFNSSQGKVVKNADNTHTFTWSSSNVNGEIYRITNVDKKANVKYFISCEYYTDDDNIYTFYVSSQSHYQSKNFETIEVGAWNKYDIVLTSQSDRVNVFFQFGARRRDSTINSSFSIRNAVVFDLTAMFGEGKEPTIEQFRKMYPCDYYPYCEGEWRYANKGQWVNFNQLIDINSISLTNCTISKINDIYTISKKNISSYAICRFTSMNDRHLENHKYLYCITSISTNTGGVRFGITNSSGATRTAFSNHNYNIVGNSYLLTPAFSENSNFANTIRIALTEGVNDYSFKNVQVIDLTQMFGEGNEPTTVEEFKALYPNEYYEYVESRYEDTGGYYEDGQVVEHIPDTAFVTPIPELPEEIRCVENPKIEVGSKGVMWNQLSKITSSGVSSGLTTTRIDDITAHITGTSSITSQPEVLFDRIIVQTGHIYYTNVICLEGDAEKMYMKSFNGTFRSMAYFGEQIKKNTYSVDNYKARWQLDLRDRDDAEIDIVIRLQAIDLTLMFGAGNEPTTVEEFRAMFPKDYYPYDAGTLRTIQGLHPIVPTTTEIPFKLYGANGINDTCEPCVLVDGEWKCRVTRRWGSVDMGSLGWNYEARPEVASYRRFWSSTLPIPMKGSYSNKNILSPYYYHSNNLINPLYKDGAMCQYNQKIYLYNSLYTDAASFKTAMQGVPLIYELETPTIELYDPIPVRTLPINSIIDCDAEMEANIKVVDRVM
ncbi:MAG: hypothetical protein MJZ30_12450 [Paludibacteraceae bacterium]|nr:hypothetical protein [Paludibacteraceae bacterium]